MPATEFLDKKHIAALVDALKSLYSDLPYPQASGDADYDRDQVRMFDAMKKLPQETARQIEIENPRVLSLDSLINMVPEASKNIQEFDEGEIAPYPYPIPEQDLDAIVNGFSEDLHRLFNEQLAAQKRDPGLPNL